jgi:hypothetical protein
VVALKDDALLSARDIFVHNKSNEQKPMKGMHGQQQRQQGRSEGGLGCSRLAEVIGFLPTGPTKVNEISQ